MRKVIVREKEGGRFDLEGFGRGLAGADGLSQFCLVIESKSRHWQMEFPGVSAFDLFTKIDLKSQDYLHDRFRAVDFVRVKEESGELVVEAKTGSLYDFFKERAASGHCILQCPLPIAFYWSGSVDQAA